MNDVQLDKNTYARRLRDQCNEKKQLTCFAPPLHLRGQHDDEEIVAFSIENERLLLTYDRPIAYECPDLLERGFPGILILSLEDNSPKRMTRKIAMQMLAVFKHECPDWLNYNCRNSIIELQPTRIFVNHVERSVVTLTKYLDRSQAGWQLELQGLLNTNAGRPLRIDSN
jgi:predicted nuclease of predicted toxin-antitoxin system